MAYRDRSGEPRLVDAARLDLSILFPPPRPGRPNMPLSIQNQMFLVAMLCQSAGMNIEPSDFTTFTRLTRVSVDRPEPGESRWTRADRRVSETDLQMMFDELRRYRDLPTLGLPHLFIEILRDRGYTIVPSKTRP